MRKINRWCGVIGLATLGLTGCIKLTTENEIKPIEVKPIHITVDVNVKVDRALDDFFGDLDSANGNVNTTENKE